VTRYERRHPEIFNPIEQERLAGSLRKAVGAIRSEHGDRPMALDLGCGTGNVTRHLVEEDLYVLAADVSSPLLRVIKRRFRDSDRVRALLVSGDDLSALGDSSVDLAAAYSVLHHVPDYLRILEELVRVLRPGGVLYLDHEVNEAFWETDGCVARFREAIREWEISRPGWWNPARRRWQRFLLPSKYVLRLRRALNPAYPFDIEGDIHVWAWDHIEWDQVVARLVRLGMELVSRSDYLHYSSAYPYEVWSTHRDRCSDMRCVIARRLPDQGDATPPGNTA
jgi:SAM-dependent methyltransferase